MARPRKTQQGPSRRPSSPTHSSALALAAALAAAAPACGGKSSAPLATPSVARAATGGRSGAPGPAADRPGVDAPDAPPPWASDVSQPDPEARRLFLARVGQPAAPLAPAARPSRVTASALFNTARGEAQGMRAEGGVTSAELAEGERASVPVTIAPGDCATFIAQGGIGLVEVDLFLSAPSAPRQVLAEDPSGGPIAVIGGRGACYPNSGRTPLAAELSVVARRGAGQVLVQGYRRAGGPAPEPRPKPRPVTPVPAAPVAPTKSAPLSASAPAPASASAPATAPATAPAPAPAPAARP